VVRLARQLSPGAAAPRPIGLLPVLADTVRSTPASKFDERSPRSSAARSKRLSPRFETGARAARSLSPASATTFVRLGYQLVGLANRLLYSTATRARAESLLLADRRAAHGGLLRAGWTRCLVPALRGARPLRSRGRLLARGRPMGDRPRPLRRGPRTSFEGRTKPSG
jgi:hypothetical protein